MQLFSARRVTDGRRVGTFRCEHWCIIWHLYTEAIGFLSCPASRGDFNHSRVVESGHRTSNIRVFPNTTLSGASIEFVQVALATPTGLPTSGNATCASGTLSSDQTISKPFSHVSAVLGSSQLLTIVIGSRLREIGSFKAATRKVGL